MPLLGARISYSGTCSYIVYKKASIADGLHPNKARQGKVRREAQQIPDPGAKPEHNMMTGEAEAEQKHNLVTAAGRGKKPGPPKDWNKCRPEANEGRYRTEVYPTRSYKNCGQNAKRQLSVPVLLAHPYCCCHCCWYHFNPQLRTQPCAPLVHLHG